MCINEQHDPVGEHRSQLREARIAVGGGHVRRRGAARKCLESEQQPHRIVRHVECERAVG